MAVYLIHFNIKSGDSTLAKVGLILNNYVGMRHEVDSWLIKTEEPAGIILEKLRGLLDNKDTAMIIGITPEYACNYHEKIKHWINTGLFA